MSYDPDQYWGLEKAAAVLKISKASLLELCAANKLQPYMLEKLALLKINKKGKVIEKETKFIYGCFPIKTEVIQGYLLKIRTPDPDDMPYRKRQIGISLDKELLVDPGPNHVYSRSQHPSYDEDGGYIWVDLLNTLRLSRAEIRSYKLSKVSKRTRDIERGKRVDSLQNEIAFTTFLALANKKCHRLGKPDALFNKDGNYSASAIMKYAESNPDVSAGIYDFDKSTYLKGHESASITRRVRALNANSQIRENH